MTEQASSEQVASEYFEAWRAGDAERTRPLFSPDIDFAGPMGVAHGAEEAVKGLGYMFAITQEVEVVHRWIDGADVITWFALTTADVGPLAIANWTHVTGGLIDRIRVTFDPRPMLG